MKVADIYEGVLPKTGLQKIRLISFISHNFGIYPFCTDVCISRGRESVVFRSLRLRNVQLMLIQNGKIIFTFSTISKICPRGVKIRGEAQTVEGGDHRVPFNYMYTDSCCLSVTMEFSCKQITVPSILQINLT